MRNKQLAFWLAASMAITPLKVQANPAILPVAPAICATGIGCIFLGTTVIGGILYYIWETSDGKKVRTRVKRTPKKTGTTYSRPIDGIEASKRGDAHWIDGTNVQRCYQIAKKYGRTVKAHYPAKGGGTWCVFDGEQRALGE